MLHRRFTRRALAQVTAAALLAASGAALAQAQPFPAKPVTIVNPNAPGGFVDIVGRGLAQSLQVVLKQPVIILNKPGANGAIGAAQVAQSAPDGYTLLVSTPSLSTQPAIDALYGKPPAYNIADFEPLAQITSDPAVVVVHPSLGVKNVAEFVALAKAKQGDVIIASSGTYGATHLPMAMLEMAAGVKFRHVPTSGGAPAMTMTLGGHSNAVAAGPGVAWPHVQAGKLVAIAQSGGKRIAPFNDTPTFKEAGVDMEYWLWTSVFAPAKTPAAVLTTLRNAIRQAVQDPEFRNAMQKGSSNIAYMDGEEFAAAFARDTRKLQDTVRFIGKVEEVK